jgi:parallel beta-helix repeat protein
MKIKVLSVILSVLIFSQCWSTQSCAKLKAISAGEGHTLALDEYGSLWACGGGEPYYQLGLGNISENVLYLRQVHGPNGVGKLNNVIAFDAGWVHSLAVANGFCYAWGVDYYENVHGILGNGPGQQDSSVPIRVHGLNDDLNGLRNIVKVSAGRSGLHSLAVDSNGYVYAWGRNYPDGQCGDGGYVNNQFPVLVVDSGADPNNTHLGDEAFIIDVDAGVNHSLALDDEGYVYEWGGNNGSPIPQKVRGSGGSGDLRNIIDIATCKISLAADVNGNVWQWTTGYPAKIPRFGHIVKVAAGYFYDYRAAIDSNGNVWQWTGSSPPVKVLDGQMYTPSGYLENIIALDVGYFDHRVAVDRDGFGWGWGVNSVGLLGVGDTNSHPRPTRMLYPLATEPNVWNITKDVNYITIGDAVSHANNSGDVIVVYPGIYNENVNSGSKQITLKSSNPADPLMVAYTIILGIGDSTTVSVANGSILDGLTIVGGDGYGVYSLNSTITRCRVIGSLCDGISTGMNGGIVDRCDIADNSIGISASSSTAVITNNIIHHNRCYGIHLYNSSSAQIRNNTIVDNGDYGIYKDYGAPIINSNLIWDNGNKINNSLWGISSKVNFNCIQGEYTGDGIHNIINQNPQFRNAGSDDCHLMADSNCIDKGDPNFVAGAGETDIDGEARVMDGNSDDVNRVDIGADEFHYCSGRVDISPASPDGIVNFLDLAVFADAWMTSAGDGNYNDVVDFADDGVIDYKDLDVFCDCWLYATGNYESSFGGEMMMSMQPEEEFMSESLSILAQSQPQQDVDQMMMESQQDEQQDEQESMMPDYNLPAIYLTCDTNTPDPNDEITVWVHSEAPLFAMGMGIYVIGDANITTAMSEADCNQFGWDNGWNSDPYIDPNGYVFISGVRWESDANGTVSYIKFRYHSGQVSVYIDQEYSIAFSWDGQSCPIVPLSQEVLLIGRDPND